MKKFPISTFETKFSDLSISVGDTQVYPSSKVIDIGAFFKANISLFLKIFVVFVSLLIFTCVASEEFGTF